MSNLTVIRDVAPNVATFSRPFARFGLVPIGGRSTAVKLTGTGAGAAGGDASGAAGGVWVLASTPLDGPTQTKLKEMGEVKYIVAGDLMHHLYLGDYAKAFPDAKLIGVDGLTEKRSDLKVAGEYGRDDPATKYGYEDEIQAHYFPTFSNKDMAFLHKESKSLIITDLLFNLPAFEQYKNTPKGKPASWVPFLGGFSDKLKPDSSLHQSFLWNTGALNDVSSYEKKQNGNKTTTTEERRKHFAQDAETVAGWDFNRIIPCHGDVLEANGKQSWLQAFSRYLGPDGKPKI